MSDSGGGGDSGFSGGGGMSTTDLAATPAYPQTAAEQISVAKPAMPFNFSTPFAAGDGSALSFTGTGGGNTPSTGGAATASLGSPQGISASPVALNPGVGGGPAIGTGGGGGPADLSSLYDPN